MSSRSVGGERESHGTKVDLGRVMRQFGNGPLEPARQASKYSPEVYDFKVGDRVGIVRMAWPGSNVSDLVGKYGHITYICDFCDHPDQRSKCMTVELHSSCGGGSVGVKGRQLEYAD